MSTRKEILRLWTARLSQADVDSPQLSAQVLLAHVLGVPRLEMLLDLEKEVESVSVAAFESLAGRRLRGEPVAYLTGTKEFYGLTFQVGPDVLIPRPETELLLEYLESRYASDRAFLAVDIGTGSGALAVTCSHLFPRVRVLAVDISRAALRVARINAKALRAEERICFFQGNLLEAVRLEFVDVLLANLPYVPERTRQELCREVLDFEPERALFSGSDGLDCYRELASELKGRMHPGALLVCEMDAGQGAALTRLFSWAQSVRILPDYSGRDRVAVVIF